jgi:DNA-binding transcriptional regulator YiaG
MPLPAPGELAAAVGELPRLWSAPSTAERDRKRLLRTLLGDVTLRPGGTARELRVGLRWNSGAAQELVVQRMRPVTEWRRAAPAAVALARQVGPSLTNPELAAALNAAGHTTGTGKPFDTTGACNLRYAYKIGSPDLLALGELTPRGVAERLEISMSTVHAWLGASTLPARRSPTGRWCIPFDAEAEAACRHRLATSPHVHRDRDDIDRQSGELSIAEVAGRLGVKADAVYYWAQRGYLPTRRGKSGRRWVNFTTDLQASCEQRITNSYKFPPEVKSQTAHPMEGIAV